MGTRRRDVSRKGFTMIHIAKNTTNSVIEALVSHSSASNTVKHSKSAHEILILTRMGDA
jgi:hypothetical protein